MSAATDSRAELVKLARLLGLEGPASLTGMRRAPAGELRAYREAVTELLYDDELALLERLADAAPLLPARTLATIGERALGPLICARMTGLLEVDRAAEIARHFAIDFLARVAAELDPRRAVDVVTSTPPDRARALSLALAARGEHVAMGRFVAYLDRRTLAACIAALTDGDVLRVTFVLEGKERVAEIVDLIGPQRTRSMLEAAEELGLAEEALDLLDHLDSRRRSQLREGTRG